MKEFASHTWYFARSKLALGAHLVDTGLLLEITKHSTVTYSGSSHNIDYILNDGAIFVASHRDNIHAWAIVNISF